MQMYWEIDFFICMKYKVKYQQNGKLKSKIITLKTQIEFSTTTLPQNTISIKPIYTIPPQFYLLQSYKTEILDMFIQLDMMLSSKLNFSSSIELMLQTKHKPIIKEILETILQALKNSIPIDMALQPYKHILGELPIVLLKLGFDNGNLEESIHSLVIILQEEKLSKEKLYDAFRYPLILLATLFISLNMIFIYVLPNFESIFKMFKGDLPISTQLLLATKDFLYQYGNMVILSIAICSITIFILCKIYKEAYDKFIISYIPILSKVIQYYYFYRLFLVLSTIVESKYKFQIAIANSKFVINNKYLQNILDNILQNITNGLAISEAFKQNNIFNSVTIELLHTAEHTNNYSIVLKDIYKHNKKNFDTYLKNFSSIIEPSIVFLISVIILWLILAIMLPMWNLNSVINPLK